MKFSIVPRPACASKTTLDFTPMEGRIAIGWLSTDYGTQLAQGRATQSAPPPGEPGSWLSGYAPNTTCLYEVLTPPGSTIWVTLLHNKLDYEEDFLEMFEGTLQTDTATAAIAKWDATTVNGTAMILRTGRAGASLCSNIYQFACISRVSILSIHCWLKY